MKLQPPWHAKDNSCLKRKKEKKQAVTVSIQNKPHWLSFIFGIIHKMAKMNFKIDHLL